MSATASSEPEPTTTDVVAGVWFTNPYDQLVSAAPYVGPMTDMTVCALIRFEEHITGSLIRNIITVKDSPVSGGFSIGFNDTDVQVGVTSYDSISGSYAFVTGSVPVWENYTGRTVGRIFAVSVDFLENSGSRVFANGTYMGALEHNFEYATSPSDTTLLVGGDNNGTGSMDGVSLIGLAIFDTVLTPTEHAQFAQQAIKYNGMPTTTGFFNPAPTDRWQLDPAITEGSGSLDAGIDNTAANPVNGNLDAQNQCFALKYKGVW